MNVYLRVYAYWRCVLVLPASESFAHYIQVMRSRTDPHNQNEEIEEEAEDRTSALETMLPPEIMALGSNFPTSPTNSPITNRHERFTNLMAYLPDLQKATQLRDIYFHRAAWM